MWEIVVLGAATFYFAYQLFLHPLSNYPGPPLAAITNLWKFYHVIAGDYEKQLLDLHKQYGKIIRIGPNHLDISDAEAVKDIFMSGKSFVKSPFYDAFTALRPNIFGTRDEQVHAARRRAISNGFSLKHVSEMEPFIDGCLAKLIARLDKAAVDGEPIDLKAWVSFFVIDVLGELAFSRSFNMLERGDIEAMPPLREHVFLSMVSGQLPFIIPYVNKYFAKVPVKAVQDVVKSRVKLRQLAVNCVNTRLANPDPGRRDLLAKLIDEYEHGDTGLDVVDVQTEAFGFIIAGSHTTATTITFIMWHLLRNPSILSRLEDEVLAAQLPGTSNGAAGAVPYSATTGLKLLQAVVQETYRISPVFTMPLMRVVPPSGGGGDGALIAGFPVPAGTDVSVCNFALHHCDARAFGDELGRFVPERWTGPEAGERARWLMPFGAGHRACIGRNLASVEIGKVVTSLVRRFKFEAVEGVDTGEGAGWLPPTESFGILDFGGRLMVKVERRGSE